MNIKARSGRVQHPQTKGDQDLFCSLLDHTKQTTNRAVEWPRTCKQDEGAHRRCGAQPERRSRVEALDVDIISHLAGFRT